MLHLAAQYTDLELLVWMLEFAAQHAFPLSMSNDQAGLSALDYAIQNQWWQVLSTLATELLAPSSRPPLCKLLLWADLAHHRCMTAR